MLKRHKVEILLKAGHRKTEVARLTGVSLCSVKRIAQALRGGGIFFATVRLEPSTPLRGDPRATARRARLARKKTLGGSRLYCRPKKFGATTIAARTWKTASRN
jgi:hypothetical protein